MLIESAIETLPPREPEAALDHGVGLRGLADLAGHFAGGPGNTAENAEIILEVGVDSMNGLSVR